MSPLRSASLSIPAPPWPRTRGRRSSLYAPRMNLARRHDLTVMANTNAGMRIRQSMQPQYPTSAGSLLNPVFPYSLAKPGYHMSTWKDYSNGAYNGRYYQQSRPPFPPLQSSPVSTSVVWTNPSPPRWSNAVAVNTQESLRMPSGSPRSPSPPTVPVVSSGRRIAPRNLTSPSSATVTLVNSGRSSPPNRSFATIAVQNSGQFVAPSVAQSVAPSVAQSVAPSVAQSVAPSVSAQSRFERSLSSPAMSAGMMANLNSKHRALGENVLMSCSSNSMPQKPSITITISRSRDQTEVNSAIGSANGRSQEPSIAQSQSYSKVGSNCACAGGLQGGNLSIIGEMINYDMQCDDSYMCTCTECVNGACREDSELEIICDGDTGMDKQDDHRLRNWRRALAKRKEIVDKIMLRTGKRASQVLINRDTTVHNRDKGMILRLMERANDVDNSSNRKQLILQEHSRCYGWYTDLMETMPRHWRQHRSQSKFEISGLPAVSKREILGGQQENMKRSRWVNSKVLRKRICENKQNIYRVVQFFPDIENLQVLGTKMTIYREEDLMAKATETPPPDPQEIALETITLETVQADAEANIEEIALETITLETVQADADAEANIEEYSSEPGVGSESTGSVDNTDSEFEAEEQIAETVYDDPEQKFSSIYGDEKSCVCEKEESRETVKTAASVAAIVVIESKESEIGELKVHANCNDQKCKIARQPDEETASKSRLIGQKIICSDENGSNCFLKTTEESECSLVILEEEDSSESSTVGGDMDAKSEVIQSTVQYGLIAATKSLSISSVVSKEGVLPCSRSGSSVGHSSASEVSARTVDVPFSLTMSRTNDEELEAGPCSSKCSKEEKLERGEGGLERSATFSVLPKGGRIPSYSSNAFAPVWNRYSDEFDCENRGSESDNEKQP